MHAIYNSAKALRMKHFFSQIKAVKPKIVNGLDLYDMSCGCCWDIEDDNFKQRREEALRQNVNAIFF